MPWSEERLHTWLATRPLPETTIGSPGHDAAILRACGRRRAVCVDQTIEGVHYDSSVSPKRIARKAVGRALSDLAASAARPRQILMGLSAPASKTERWMRALISAADERARDFGAELVAGDLACAAGPVRITITALGELSGPKRPPGRDRARAGQLLLLTGPTGGSSRGRHLDLVPRVEEGCWLHAQGATAMMDVSDGLALDLSRLARASGVGIELHEVPIHRDARWLQRRDRVPALEHAMGDGEDYELIATIDSKRWKPLQRRAQRRFPALRVIGRIVKTPGLRVVDENGSLKPWLKKSGWLHG